MADPQIPAPLSAADSQGASFSIDRIYTKDLSLENPGSPQSFQLTGGFRAWKDAGLPVEK